MGAAEEAPCKTPALDGHAVVGKPARWTCYILECADGTLYTGIARDAEARLSRHNRGLASKCTRARLPVRIVYREGFPDRASAARREAQIKRMRRERKLAMAGLPARRTR